MKTLDEALAELEKQEDIKKYLESQGFSITCIRGALCATCPVAQFVRARTGINYEVALDCILLDDDFICHLSDKLEEFVGNITVELYENNLWSTREAREPS